jgi:Nucleotidyl transferase of unknown function (DUF2204)
MPSAPPPEEMLTTMKRCAAALRDAGIPFAVGGSFAVWARGGPSSDHDVDFMIREQDAAKALEVLADIGLRTERPPEGWLVKAYDGDVLVDLIYAPSGVVVDDALLGRCEEYNVHGMPLPVLAADVVLVSKLLALNEHHLDFEGLLAMARAVREQVDWASVREKTSESPYARGFLTLAQELDIIPG